MKNNFVQKVSVIFLALGLITACGGGKKSKDVDVKTKSAVTADEQETLYSYGKAENSVGQTLTVEVKKDTGIKVQTLVSGLKKNEKDLLECVRGMIVQLNAAFNTHEKELLELSGNKKLSHISVICINTTGETVEDQLDQNRIEFLKDASGNENKTHMVIVGVQSKIDENTKSTTHSSTEALSQYSPSKAIGDFIDDMFEELRESEKEEKEEEQEESEEETEK